MNHTTWRKKLIQEEQERSLSDHSFHWSQILNMKRHEFLFSSLGVMFVGGI